MMTEYRSYQTRKKLISAKNHKVDRKCVPINLNQRRFCVTSEDLRMMLPEACENPEEVSIDVGMFQFLMK